MKVLTEIKYDVDYQNVEEGVESLCRQVNVGCI